LRCMSKPKAVPKGVLNAGEWTRPPDAPAAPRGAHAVSHELVSRVIKIFEAHHKESDDGTVRCIPPAAPAIA
jgi:hypothetical protein